MKLRFSSPAKAAEFVQRLQQIVDAPKFGLTHSVASEFADLISEDAVMVSASYSAVAECR
jgi:hypothetical protein